MSKTIIKKLIFTLLFIPIAFFLNSSIAKADSGYASCYYHTSTYDEHAQGAMSYHQVAVVITVKKEGGYSGTAQLGYAGGVTGDVLSSKTASEFAKWVAKNEKDIHNKDTMFTPGFENQFYKDNQWTCPSNVYVKQGLIWWYVNLNADSNHTYKLSLTYNESKQDGNSSDAKDLEEYSDKASDDYKDDGKLNNTNTDTTTKEIKKWANSKTSKTKYTEECDNVISPTMRKMLNNLFTIIQVIGIILMVILTASEFIKIITGSEEDGLRSAFKHTIVRIVVVVILLLLPMFINWILNVVEIQNASGKDATICSLQINHNNLLE